jgi:hypothetical protein
MKRIAFVGFLSKNYARLASFASELGYTSLNGGCIDDGSNCCRNGWAAASRADVVLVNKSFTRYLGAGFARDCSVVSVHGLSSARKWLSDNVNRD